MGGRQCWQRAFSDPRTASTTPGSRSLPKLQSRRPCGLHLSDTFPPLTCLEVVDTRVEGAATVHVLRPSVSRAVENDALEQNPTMRSDEYDSSAAAFPTSPARARSGGGAAAAAAAAAATEAAATETDTMATTATATQTGGGDAAAAKGREDPPTPPDAAVVAAQLAAAQRARAEAAAAREAARLRALLRRPDETLVREVLRLTGEVQTELDPTRLPSGGPPQGEGAAAQQPQANTSVLERLAPPHGAPGGGGDCCKWLRESSARRRQLLLYGAPRG